MVDRSGSPENAASVGARLRAAREAAGLSLEEVAQRTRVPQRHLSAIETSDMEVLPAPPYAVGFVKSYARLLGLPTEELGREFRAELVAVLDERPVTPAFAPADPARVPPRWLAVVALIVAVAIAVGYGLWRSGRLGGDTAETRDALASNLAADMPAAVAPASHPVHSGTAPANASGPVVITATADAWIRVSDGDKRLYMDVLKAGDHFAVPADAIAPVIRTGAPQLLTITAGGTAAPTLGPPSTLVRAASLKPADLFGQNVPTDAAAVPPPVVERDSSPSDRPQRHQRHRLPPAFANDPAPATPTPADAAPSTPGT